MTVLDQNPARQRIAQSLTQSIPFVLMSTVCITAANGAGLFAPVANTTLDSILRLNLLPPDDVFVVGITDQDYERIFENNSPLSGEKLSRLLEAIAEGEPKVIVVDVDTSDRRFCSFNYKPLGCPVVWGRGIDGELQSTSKSWFSSDPIFIADPILGGCSRPERPNWGVAVMPQDGDGLVRHYCQFVPIAGRDNNSQITFAPTLSQSAVQLFRGEVPHGAKSSGGKIVMRLCGGSRYMPHISCSDLLPLASGTGWKQMVRGKVVLLGGMYEAARDSYLTPTGFMSGVELQAQAIQTTLNRGYPEFPELPCTAVCEVLAGLSLAVGNSFSRRAFAVSGLIPLSALLFSFVTLSLPSLWFCCVLMLGSVQAQHLVSLWRRPGRLRDSGADGATQVDKTLEERVLLAPRLRAVCLGCGAEFEDATTQLCPYDDLPLSKIMRDELEGTVFADRYLILEQVGEGGMSTVYLAQHKLLEQKVAIKVLRSHLESDKKSLMRFQQEAKATVKISHPNVVSVYDFGITPEGKAYLVMDFVEGTSLKERISKFGRLNLSDCMNLFIQIADGLQCVHNNGVVHRDLKPSNIMLVAEQSRELVKIVDFGLAKMASVDLALTASDQVVGSPLYMSPEQCAGSHVDQRSDIYSFGCIMYECLAGHPPFLADGVLQIFKMHAEAKPDSFQPSWEIPVFLEELVFRCMSKHPEQRFATVAEIQERLLSC